MLHYPVPAILHVSASDSVFKKLIKLVFFHIFVIVLHIHSYI